MPVLKLLNYIFYAKIIVFFFLLVSVLDIMLYPNIEGLIDSIDINPSIVHGFLKV
jgi:hypothetical protein